MAKTASKIESQPAVKFSAKIKTAIDSKTKKTAVKAKTEEHSMEYSVEKLQKIGEQGAAVIEAVQNKRAYIVRHSREEQSAAPEKMVHQVLQAWQLLRKIEALQDELEPMLEELRPKLLGQSLVIPGVCRLAVATTSSVGIKDPQKLHELLGEKFESLVIEKATYKPTKKLIEMSADADDPMAPAYRALLTIKSGSSIKFSAEK